MKDSASLNTARGLLNQVLPTMEVDHWRADTPLLGALPDFDSMAMVALITLTEENLGVMVNDADISAEDFVTLGSFAAWIDQLQA